MTAEVGWRLARRLALALAAAAVLAWFENPLLSACVVCLEFAVEDFLAAWWLVRTDPDRGRGWAVGLLHAAGGFWKATLINYALLTAAILYSLVSGRPGWPQPPPGGPVPNFRDDGLFPWAVAAIFGYLLAWAAGLAAYALAYRRRVKLWIGPAAREARRRGEWPPSAGGSWLFWRPALVLTAVPVVLALLGCAARLFPVPPGVNAGTWNTSLILHFLAGVMLALPPMGLSGTLQERGSRDLLARRPGECWGEGK